MKQPYSTNGNTDPMHVIFNYNDVFFSFFYDDESGCTHRSHDFAMNYVYSGMMLIDNGTERISVDKGECAFIPRDHRITIYKRTAGGERYCGIFLNFKRNFLRGMYARIGRNEVPAGTPKLPQKVMKLPKTAEITSLFTSLTPYFNADERPRDDLMQLKLQEGLLALLHIDKRFMPTLFDFNEPWKIDILEFLNSNYMYEFTQEELAHYTGRSLATFKRDFKKVSDLTPEKWIIRKRLEAAYSIMQKGNVKVTDICSKVGFKNPSHFSTAFKRQYGMSPTAMAAQ